MTIRSARLASNGHLEEMQFVGYITIGVDEDANPANKCSRIGSLLFKNTEKTFLTG